MDSIGQKNINRTIHFVKFPPNLLDPTIAFNIKAKPGFRIKIGPRDYHSKRKGLKKYLVRIQDELFVLSLLALDSNPLL